MERANSRQRHWVKQGVELALVVVVLSLGMQARRSTGMVRGPGLAADVDTSRTAFLEAYRCSCTRGA
jgi:hypothetical protein